FAPQGDVLASVGGESLQYRPGDVKLWNYKTGALEASLDNGHPTNVWSVAWSADAKTLVTTGYDGKVVVWNVAEKKPTATLTNHKGWCRAVAFTANGSHFATGGEDGTVIVWEAGGPKDIKTFKAHESAVYGLTFSPDGSTLATAS